MFENLNIRKLFIFTLVIIMIIFLSVFCAQYATAHKTVHNRNANISSYFPDGADTDDNVDEVGVEWINNYPDPFYDVIFNDNSCLGLFDGLRNSGWKDSFNWGEQNAFASDYKNEANDGNENQYPDSVDISMVCAMGNVNGIVFYNQGGFSLVPSEAYHSYGDRDLEWLAFDSSSVLHDDSYLGWAETMEGLHLLLGFKTQMYSTEVGDGTLWARHMKGRYICSSPTTITQGWFQTVDDLQPAETCARILAESQDSYQDYLWNIGDVTPDTPIGYPRYYLDHCSTQPASKADLARYDQPKVLAMPVVQVVDRVVDEDYVKNIIAPAFGLEAEVPCSFENLYAISSTSDGITRNLLVDQVTGGFSYHNLSMLWTTPDITPTLPSPTEATLIVDDWFRNTPALYLPAAGYRNAGFEYMTEDIIGFNVLSGDEGALQSKQVSDLPVDISMIYPRKLYVATKTVNGSQAMDFPVFGPGGRMKIYLGDQGEIIGAQGGSRDVQVMVDQVNILDAEAVWTMFLADPSLVIGQISLFADTITHSVPILGYYEMPYIIQQEDLIPVWEFRGYFYLDGNLIAADVPIYLPAAAEYMPPQASITKPVDGSIFWSGTSILFESAVTGGTPPYTYKWTSSKDGLLGDTINIAATLSSPIKQGSLSTHEVSFQVVDANGLASTATISLMIKPIFWMPMVNK